MRIIAGTARGTRLRTPKGWDTRPTADRVKESLFDILGARVQNACVLDLFAGTGALGLEALSRGAAHAVLVDKATPAVLRENAAHTRLAERTEIRAGDAFSELARFSREERVFDFIFCDPPYRLGLWARAIASIDAGALLAKDGVVVCEHEADENELPALSSLACIDRRSYGRTTQLSFWKRCGKEGGVS